MAESSSGQEKTEQATAKKLSEARQEGQIPRSRELNTFVMLMAASAGLFFMGADIVNSLMNILHNSISFERAVLFSEHQLPHRFLKAIEAAIWAVAPFLLLMVIAAILSPMALGGATFSVKVLTPKIDKLDPIKGLKKLFAWKSFVELLKSLGKFIIVAMVGYFILKTKLPKFILLGNTTVNQGIGYVGTELLWAFFLLSCTLIIVVLIDIPFQLWDYNRQQKMTLQETKDERKDMEGSPELKNKVRKTQLKMAARRMMEQVPNADVVVTNPSHYAVALKYDQSGSGAPVVVATGIDLVALQIRRVAAANDVAVLEAPPLARALYYSAELDHEIPHGLYLAVAQVLAYVYQLQNYKKHGGVEPQLATELPIPDELKRD